MTITRISHLQNLQKDIEDFVKSSGCKSFIFLPLKSTTGGVSTYERCVISSNIEFLPLNIYLYIILHEISHQFQYSKYGKDIALPVYDGSIDIDSATQHLLYLESTADRLALSKLRHLNNKHNLGLVIPPPRYLNMKDTSRLKKYVENLQIEVKANNLKSIESINDYILKKYSLDDI